MSLRLLKHFFVGWVGGWLKREEVDAKKKLGRKKSDGGEYKKDTT